MKEKELIQERFDLVQNYLNNQTEEEWQRLVQKVKMNENYNGWSNYATWRINLEIVDSWTTDDFEQIEDDVYDLSSVIREKVEDIIESEDNEIEKENAFIYSYATAFLSDVNWLEIAEHIVEKFPVLIKNK